MKVVCCTRVSFEYSSGVIFRNNILLLLLFQSHIFHHLLQICKIASSASILGISYLVHTFFCPIFIFYLPYFLFKDGLAV